MSDKRIRIIVVEDQQIARTGLLMVLERDTRIEVVGEAGDGPSAVEQSLALKPDVVLMDIMLPGIDGIEATRQIKAQSDSIRILMLTSYERDDDVFAALGAGADGYCLKNVNTEQLLNAIIAVADGAAWLDAAVAARVLRSTKSQPPTKTAQKRSGPEERFGLSARENEVLALLVEGLSNQQIADRLVLSTETVKTHLRHIMEKLAVADRTQAAIKAMRHGLF